jgi:beta-lactamase regulating signal transducer with metallopeptidase domain
MTFAFALLLDATIKACLLCLAAAAAAVLFRHRSAALRHDLHLAALAGCLLLPFAAAALRLFGPELRVAPVHEAVVALTPSLPAAAPARAIEIVDRIWSGDGGSGAFGMAAALFALVWLAGFLVEAARSLAAWRGASAVARRARPFPIDAALDIRLTEALASPAVFGSTILLPEEARCWSAERRDAVLAHEAAHVRRRDAVAETLVQLACALHWFNPLVRTAARALRRERELACDEQVVRQGFDPGGYAGILVEIARKARIPRRTPLLAMAAMPELERRVRRLVAAPAARRSRGIVRAALLVPTLALSLFGAALTAPAAGVLGPGSVQPASGPLGGLDDPMSELLPFDYDGAAPAAAALTADGPDAAAIAILQGALGRVSHGYGDLVRERAIWVLAQVRDGRLFEPLAARLDDSDWRVRAYAAWGLATTADRRATPLFVGLLDDPVWRVRAMAAEALGEAADPAAAGAVAGLAGDPAWQVRMGALHYLGRVRDPALARRLRALRTDPHPGTRMVAREILARF